MDYFPLTHSPLGDILKDLEPETVADQRSLHRHPELSLQERETSRFVLEKIEALNLPYEIVGDYGFIVRLDGAVPGKTVMLRADMDALPVAEDDCNLKGPKAAVSENPGVSHACGHDAHTAVLLSAMKALYRYRARLAGTVLFCFEQAEEVGGGIFPMMTALARYQVDRVWGLHVYAGLASGLISVDPGPRMAGVSSFQIRLTGQGGHVSRPDLCRNPILCGTHIINQLNSLWATGLDPTKAVTLGISIFSGGVKSNVIPETAELAGSLRFFDCEGGKAAFVKLKETINAVAAMDGCQVEYLSDFEAPYAVINSPETSAIAAHAIEEALGPQYLSTCAPWFATESMALYLQNYPGTFAFLGIENPEKGTGAGHHTTQFEVDSDVLKLGVAATVNYAVHALEEP
ncbi:MAG: amidohydrolase [Pseudoflavonifractor sp.]